MNSWQPIDTAPKDGTSILAFAQGQYGPADVYYGVAQWARGGELPGTVDGWFWPFAIRPTHWMTIPSPPA